MDDRTYFMQNSRYQSARERCSRENQSYAHLKPNKHQFCCNRAYYNWLRSHPDILFDYKAQNLAYATGNFCRYLHDYNSNVNYKFEIEKSLNSRLKLSLESYSMVKYYAVRKGR